MKLPAVVAAACAGLLAALPLQATEFRPITDRDSFVEAVEGRVLSHRGFRLQVSRQGTITGRGLGREVTGSWKWNGPFFCRDLRWGSTEVGFNCQAVAVNGASIRFQADEGRGEVAVFRMR